MKQKNIIVSKTARYFISGNVSEKTEQIWFVCHGYGQLANYFIRNFDSLDPKKNLIIAPEGLHRFYWKGFSDKVVASWMTKEDRESDISDYVNYLDKVYEEVLSQFGNKKVKINVLGFSQGTATVCRWIANKRSKIDNLILWAGAFPDDMDLEKNKDHFNSIRTFVVVGDTDEFIKEKQVKEHEEFLTKIGFDFELIRFEGKHEIVQATLLNLVERL